MSRPDETGAVPPGSQELATAMSAEEQAAFARDALASAPMALLGVDRDFRVVAAVSGERFGVTVGVRITEALLPLIGQEAILAGLFDRPGSLYELPDLSWKDASGRGFEATIRIEADAERGMLRVLLVDAGQAILLRQRLVQETNELILRTDALSAAQERAEAAENAKRAFLAHTSDALRSPLSVILGNAAILLQERAAPLSPSEVQAFAEDIRTSGDQLEGMVEELLDLAAAEAGDLTLLEDWADPSELVETALARLHSASTGGGGSAAANYAAGSRLTLDPLPWSPSLWVDAGRIRQALMLLMREGLARSTGALAGRVIVDPSTGWQLRLEWSDAAVDAPSSVPDQSLSLRLIEQLAHLHDGAFVVRDEGAKGGCWLFQLPAGRLSDPARNGANGGGQRRGRAVPDG
ncbi:MAG: histidine kinase dimerization/phospho-acceptor domain-containing protein [Pseudomonadota bacterium]